MQIQSQIIEQTDSGYVLEITLEQEHKIWAYLAISEPDLDAVANIVPPEQFEAGGDVHVMAIAQADDAAQEVQEVLFSMNQCASGTRRVWPDRHSQQLILL